MRTKKEGGDVCVQDTRQRWLRWGIAHQRSREGDDGTHGEDFWKTCPPSRSVLREEKPWLAPPIHVGPMASYWLPRPTTGSARNLVRIG